MGNTLTIVAHIEAHPDKLDLVRNELLLLIAPTRAEEGCIQYDLHQDNEDPCVFKFFELWESRDLWQTHMRSEHLDAYAKATDGAIREFVLNEMSQIG